MVLRMLGSAAAVLSRCGNSRALAGSTRPSHPAAVTEYSRLFASLSSSSSSTASGCASASRRGAPISSTAFVSGATTTSVMWRRCRGDDSGGSRGFSTAAGTAKRDAGPLTEDGPMDLQQRRLLSTRRRSVGGHVGNRSCLMSTSDSGKEGESDPMIHDRDFWTDARDPYPATSSGGDAYVDGDKGRGAGGVEAFGLLEEGEDKDTWMEGVDVDPEAEAIFYGDKIPFPDLGLSATLCRHLETLNLPHSTAVQAAAIPRVLGGKDVIIGAETGSGKTLAYLLPIVERFLRGDAVAKDLPEELLGNARGWSMFPDVIVLVPNKELCEQVLSVLKEILRALSADEGITRDLTAAGMYGSSYEYPFSPNRPAPSILVCTPSFLHKYTNMKAVPLFCKATSLVMDEADMLMEGSYKKQLDDILVSFRRADKIVAEMGLPGFERTQYVLAAATLPTYGLKSVDQYVKRAFPSAHKIQQVHMHKHHPAIQQEFIKVGEHISDKIEAVVDLLRGESEAERTRTMVFANTAASCKLACEALAEEGFSFVPYHKEVAPRDRLENLKALKSGSAKILVCTDLAARGIDVPSVARIVQMEMATNVVHHLHRLGRAARAGRTGRATNFFDSSTKDLVNSIKGAEGSRLDGSFSRQRGFRKKFKKYGPSRTFQR
ncbi:unnamed protein product [Ascophyllum nodosum]